MKVFVLSLCFMHVRIAWKSLSNAHEIHPLFCLRHVRIAWKFLYRAHGIHLLFCLRHVRIALKFLYRAHGIHPLSCSRHVRIAWKILYKALEIHPNHKENHFFWNFSFKYFAVSIIIHNFALAFNKEAGWLQITPSGEMVEWSITTVLKTVVPRGTGGSNPSLSALYKQTGP